MPTKTSIATKTGRILDLLPRTFRTLPVLSALRAVADAPGRELLAAENSLAEIMRAHWCDHADRGAEVIDDLARLAALYGLAPREDESVEEFREHLKRYVRTFLEGTVTVPGILRITAETLGLRIADRPGEIDGWWRRDAPVLIEPLRRADDAAELVFGPVPAVARGHLEAPARIAGSVDLAGGFELGTATILKLKVGGAASVEIDLVGATDLDGIVTAINEALPVPVATDREGKHGDGRFLTLTSPKSGAASRLELLEPADDELDATVPLLGFVPRRARGAAAEPASLRGPELAEPLDLSSERYLRLAVDGTLLAEIDCAGADPAATTLDEVEGAVNAALGAPVATRDGDVLVLTSPSVGADSSLVFQAPAAQDARQRLFGELSASAFFGHDAQAARLEGLRDLAAGADLSERSRIRLRVDATAAVVVDLAGAVPARTELEEIVDAITAAVGAEVAGHDGRTVTVTSPKSGPTSRVALLKLDGGDAGDLVFGVSPRLYRGTSAAPARLVAMMEVDATEGVDLRALGALRLAVDDGGPVEVDLRSATQDLAHVSLDELVASLDAAAGPGVASRDGQRLVLTSPQADGSGSLRLEPLVRTRRRRFVSRAAITDEASKALFGFVEGSAEGLPAAPARLVGTKDLSRGVDLSQARCLRLAVDGGEAVEVEVAGLRPRTTTLDELTASLDAAFATNVASHDGRHLVLTSPNSGASSVLAFEAPRAGDALDAVLGVEPGVVRGSAATRVAFAATVELGDGIDLEAGVAVRLGIDGGDPVEIVLTEPAAHLSLGELTTVINLALGSAVAFHDGVRLRLDSASQGATSQLEFAVPAGPDATAALFGIAAPRVYQGLDAEPAVVYGHAVSEPLEPVTPRLLRLAVDADEAVDVDLAATTTLAEIAEALNSALAHDIASVEGEMVDGDRLVLTSPTTGLSSRLTLELVTAADARTLLLGDIDDVTTGTDPAPAVLTGEVDLLAPVDLAARRLLRLAIDGGEPIDVEVAGATPETTILAEVVAALNVAVPGLAAATDDDRLRLISLTVGEGSRLELVPRRYLEVVEYPPEAAEHRRAVRHADTWTVRNTGAADVTAVVEVRAPRGAFGAALVHCSPWGIKGGSHCGLGVKVRLGEPLSPGSVWRLATDAGSGLVATVEDASGAVRSVDPSQLHVDFLESETPSAPGDVLALPRGRTGWLYLECLAARFDEAFFDEARFAGPPCYEPGVFNASRFAPDADGGGAVFADAEARPPEVEVTVRWSNHRPGAFEVNLPAELPPRFGGRFNEGRFGSDEGEHYDGVALEPPVDENHLAERLAASVLVEAMEVAVVPLGFEAAEAPFRKPRHLSLGDDGRSVARLRRDETHAALYLAAPGLDGFLEIRALLPGAWGNEIALVVRPASPGLYDAVVSFGGARFENARHIVAGPAPPALAEELLQPGPIGVLQAKAAGIGARVTRDRADEFQSDPYQPEEA